MARRPRDARSRLLQLKLVRLRAKVRKALVDESIADGNGGKYGQWLFGQRIGREIGEDKELFEFLVINIGHQVARDDDHKQRPNFANKDDDKPELPFNYDVERDKVIPIGLAKSEDDAPQRIPLRLAGKEELNSYLKFVRANKNKVVNAFGVTETKVLMIVRTMQRHPELKNTDDVMRHRFKWKPAPRPEPPSEEAGEGALI
jgi:hypothetical protein